MMHHGVSGIALLSFLLFHRVTALDVVSGKSGEEQVKEALERAQKESEEAARKDKQESPIYPGKDQLDLKHFLKARHNNHGNLSPVSPDFTAMQLKSIGLDAASLSGLHFMNNISAFRGMEDKGIEKTDTSLERESDRKMIDMARKLNNLVQKFQRKIGRLSEGNRVQSSYLAQHPKLGNFFATHSRSPYLAQRFIASHTRGMLRPLKYVEESAQVKSIRATPKKPSGKDSVIDLQALRKALGLLHKGGNGKASAGSNTNPVGSKTSYREDTKLEDRLAMEAEEEKKFSNSDSYDYEGNPPSSKGGSGSSGVGTQTGQASFSPKEQASKEMQSYNDLISSESNRELSQIQDEITKATQSSMGQVSVVGQKEHVGIDNPNPLGGIGSLEGMGSFAGDSGYPSTGGNSGDVSSIFGSPASLKGAIDSSSIGPLGSTESFPGSQAANDALESAMQASANADMNGQSMSPQSYQEGSSSPGGEGGGGSQDGGDLGNSQFSLGGSMQEQQTDMNAMAAASNPFAGQSNSMENGGGSYMMNEQQPTFKKSVITYGGRKSTTACINPKVNIVKKKNN